MGPNANMTHVLIEERNLITDIYREDHMQTQGEDGQSNPGGLEVNHSQHSDP